MTTMLKHRNTDETVDDGDELLNAFGDRLILGGAWTWADGGQSPTRRCTKA
ncbi:MULTISPECIES: hypothetical protein [Mycobacteriaceae]|uniref:hypothetical protein n=1 Tax=Mycobacteriaceae TaxID=1762 RepID=UPI0013A53089|nr:MULTISPECIES: hypothetical protein [Mycobacteriaceae]